MKIERWLPTGLLLAATVAWISLGAGAQEQPAPNLSPGAQSEDAPAETPDQPDAERPQTDQPTPNQPDQPTPDAADQPEDAQETPEQQDAPQTDADEGVPSPAPGEQDRDAPATGRDAPEDAEAQTEQDRGAPATERDTRADLGLQLDAQAQGEGLVISSIGRTGIAARAGLLRGDRIVSIDGRQFATADEFYAYVDDFEGDRMNVVYLRDGERHQAVWMLGEQEQALQLPPTPRHAALGVRLQDGHQGAFVNGVFEGSPAHEAGLQVGDEIVAIQGRPIGNALHLAGAVREFPAGHSLTLDTIRNGSHQRIQLRLTTADRAFVGELNSISRHMAQRDMQEDGVQRGFRPNADARIQEMQREMDQLRAENRRLRQRLEDAGRGEAEAPAEAESDAPADAGDEEAAEQPDTLPEVPDLEAPEQPQQENDAETP